MSGGVLVWADLHLDQWKHVGRDPLSALHPEDFADLDALIIAGDLSNDPLRKWPRHIARLARLIEPSRIHIIPGNHDYYGLDLDADDRLAELARAEGAQLAQKTERVISGTRYLLCDAVVGSVGGGTGRAAQKDCQRIHAAPGGGTVTPDDLTARHRDHLAWLETILARPFAGPTVVISHHAPHLSLLPPGAGGILWQRPWGLIARARPDQWIFGHTHWRVERQIGGTQLRNVSLGRPDEVAPGTEAAILSRGRVAP